MAHLSLAKACPQCGTGIAGWYARLFGKDCTTEREPFANPPIDKTTWGPFACTACGAKLVLIRTDPRLREKIAGAAFVSIVAGFVLGYFIGWGGCSSCDLLLIGLFIALSGAWIITRSIRVEVRKTATKFINDTVL